jgi:hypothetical protein
VLIAVHRPGPDPKDLFYWLKVGANQDWTKAASNGQAEAEFQVGLSMVQSNLLFMVDRVPRLWVCQSLASVSLSTEAMPSTTASLRND